MRARAERTQPTAGTERAACSACGGAMAQFLEAPDFNRRISSVVFRYLRCVDCGLISLANPPPDPARYYASEYHAVPASADAIERGAEHDRYKIELVRRYAGKGRLLEIGPSWGAFCLLAKRAGFEVEAIEMDPRCCEFLASRIGVRAIHAADEAAALAQASSPDVIALWHVLEHLSDPWALLARAAERLSPGGVIVIATPNPRALQFRAFGRYWAHLDAPRHVHLIPAPILRRRMQALGLEEALYTTTDPGSLRWNGFGWRWSLANLSSSATIKRALRLAGGAAATLAAPLERGEGAGSAYTAVYRRPAV
jgi:2-polyprenyl-3-methyl-5-hydroxy-6-metoxy-1,4-benzoquinol methylase